MLLDLARLFLFPALMAFAAASDLLTMTISNRVSLLLITGFFVLAIITGMSWEAIGWHVLAWMSVLVVAFACFAFGWIGGGDAKVAAAAGLWFGFDFLLDYLLMASALGGVLTLSILSLRKWPLPSFLLSQDWLARLHDQKTGIPYGIALAAGALLVYPQTDWIKAVDLVHLAMR
jgi:prepilin peptidase CpaA